MALTLRAYEAHRNGKPPFREVSPLEPDIGVERRDDGTMLLSSPYALGGLEPSVVHLPKKWAATEPDRVFLADRTGTGGDWRRMSYAEMRDAVRALAQAVLDRGLGPDRPVMIPSANSVNPAIVSLGTMAAGLPVAPVSVAHSLSAALERRADLVDEL